MGFSAGEVTPSLAELLALEGVSTPFEEAAKKVHSLLPAAANVIYSGGVLRAHVSWLPAMVAN